MKKRKIEKTITKYYNDFLDNMPSCRDDLDYALIKEYNDGLMDALGLSNSLTWIGSDSYREEKGVGVWIERRPIAEEVSLLFRDKLYAAGWRQLPYSDIYKHPLLSLDVYISPDDEKDMGVLVEMDTIEHYVHSVAELGVLLNQLGCEIPPVNSDSIEFTSPSDSIPCNNPSIASDVRDAIHQLEDSTNYLRAVFLTVLETPND